MQECCRQAPRRVRRYTTVARGKSWLLPANWMSLIVVPFNAVIEPQDSVQNYDDVLFQNCGGAILTWWIESTVNFVRNGFKVSDSDWHR